VEWRGTDERLEQNFKIEKVDRIPSSDWVNTYQEHFRVGKYALVEVPLTRRNFEKISTAIENFPITLIGK